MKSEAEIRSLERRIFLKSFWRNPRQMGTLAPISPRLARFAATQIPLSSNNYGVEIGSGTGRLTRALLDHGVSPQNLALIELDIGCCEFLQETVPQISRIIQGNAEDIQELIPSSWVGHLDYVVSAIPFMYLTPLQRDKIVDSALECLTPEGKIVHVTYSPFSPLKHRSDLHQRRVSSLWFNVPPGFVWIFERF